MRHSTKKKVGCCEQRCQKRKRQDKKKSLLADNGSGQVNEKEYKLFLLHFLAFIFLRKPISYSILLCCLIDFKRNKNKKENFSEFVK